MRSRVIIFWTFIVAIVVHILYIGLPISTNTPDNVTLIDITYAFLSICITVFILVTIIWYSIHISLIFMEKAEVLLTKWYKKYISQTK